MDANRSKRGGGGSRPPWAKNRPPGLRGAEIGKYYRNLALKKKREQVGEDNTKPRFWLGPSVTVPPGVLSRVEECLHKFTNSGNENENLPVEFEKQFQNLLSVDFDAFIEESKLKLVGVRPGNVALSEHFKTQNNEKKAQDQKYIERLHKRQTLPTMKASEQILNAVADNQVLLIVGSTGCGKTTQVPQILLDRSINEGTGSQCRIICTQPRRISAITVAERVAYERNENLGGSVGFQIRLESKLPRDHGCILYCTTGILLQQMQSDPLMSLVSVLILDEIHERSVETDLLMALLKKILPHRPDLKLILMSATVNEQDFCEYFNNCHTLRIEGTLFPVKVVYLEDVLSETQYSKFGKTQEGRQHGRQRRMQDHEQEYSKMIEPYLRQIRHQYDAQVIQSLRCSDSEGCLNIQFLEFLIFYICAHKPPGAILVFMPGYDKISKLHAALKNPTSPFGQAWQKKIQVYPLHSMMPTVEQQSVFRPPPIGMRKVIISTIIAETSVTIDDVVYVINTGRTKTTNYNIETNIQSLEETWVTKANTKQRKGRAGRVQPGVCYNLFTKARERTMADVPTPEIVRSKLESIILNLKLLHIADPYAFLQTLLTSPNPNAIQNGIVLLKRIEALDENGILTPLGTHLAKLPVDPQMGKMLLMAALFRCLDPITSAAAALSYKSPFYTPLGLEKNVDNAKQILANNTRSDHLMVNHAIQQYRDTKKDGDVRNFCFTYFLSQSSMEQIERMKQQFADLMKSARFLESSNCQHADSNVNSDNVPLLRAIIAAGLYPNIARLSKARQIKNRVHAIHHMSTPEDGRINFHPSSVNSGASSFESNYFVYFEKQRTTALYLLDATMVFPMALIIFGDGVVAQHTPEHGFCISVANAYFFKCDQDTAEVIIRLRQYLQSLLLKKAMYPSPIMRNSAEEHLIKAIQMLLSLDEVCDFDDQYLSTDDNDDL